MSNISLSNDTTIIHDWEIHMVSVPVAILGAFGFLLNLVHLVRSVKAGGGRTINAALNINLILTDIFLCCIIVVVIPNWYISTTKLCGAALLITVLFDLSSSGALFLVSLERYIKVCHPFSYHKVLTWKFTFIGIFASWSFAVIAGLLIYFAYSPRNSQMTGFWCVFPLIHYSWNIPLFVTISVTIFMATFDYVNFRVLCVMHTQKQRIQAINNFSNHGKSNTKIKFMAWVRLVSFQLYLPFQCVYIVAAFVDVQPENWLILYSNITMCFFCVSSFSNPLLMMHFVQKKINQWFPNLYPVARVKHEVKQ